jgi:hypothetical protein
LITRCTSVRPHLPGIVFLESKCFIWHIHSHHKVDLGDFESTGDVLGKVGWSEGNTVAIVAIDVEDSSTKLRAIRATQQVNKYDVVQVMSFRHCPLVPASRTVSYAPTSTRSNVARKTKLKKATTMSDGDCMPVLQIPSWLMTPV